MELPRTLQEAVIYFADKDRCVEYLAGRRWPKGVTCPACNGSHVRYDRKRRLWECNTRHPRRQFSVKVGTIFEDSPIGLDKWLPAVWMIAGAKNGISSHELGRALGVTQKTAWFMLHRIRLSLQAKNGGKLGGDVEVDETFIGGKARNMHAGRKARALKGRSSGSFGKAVVMGLLERNTAGASKVRAMVVPSRRRHNLQPLVEQHVEDGTRVYTDELESYNNLGLYYRHNVINHAECYADGAVHTNGMENFWSLLKRSIKGTYVSVEPFHLFRYLDEQAFRFNEREGTDADRFRDAIKGIVGRRVTYKSLIGDESRSDSL